MYACYHLFSTFCLIRSIAELLQIVQESAMTSIRDGVSEITTEEKDKAVDNSVIDSNTIYYYLFRALEANLREQQQDKI